MPEEPSKPKAPDPPHERMGSSAELEVLGEVDAASEGAPSLPPGAMSSGSTPAVPPAPKSAPARPAPSSMAPVPLPEGAPPRVSSTPPPVPAAGRGFGDDDDPLLGVVLADRVKIERPIARGGMGKVYYGEQVGMKRPCAIKILDPRLAGGGDVEEFARRFLLEASTAAKLTHPNVVTIFDYGEMSGGMCFIAMEYLQGRSLSDELKKNGRLAPERAIHIAKQVSRALREAHTLGVVHRDMKPGNVFLVEKDDDEDFVKVLDFGLVKETSPTEAQDHTQVGQIMGSPRYMAPEQVQGKAVDARTDIYSLGAMLFAMLAGKPPFDKNTDLSTMMAQVSDPPPPIASVAPDAQLPPGLEAVVMKCLAKNPDERFASMEELITALKLRPGVMSTASDSGRHTQSPLLSPVLPTGDSGSGPLQRRRRSAAPMILVVAAIVGVAVTAALYLRQDETVTTQAAPPPPVGPLPPPKPSAPPPPAPPRPTAKLHVDTEPPGVKIKEEGDTVCEATPCDIVYTGEQADPTYEHLLTFLKADYKLERKLVKVSASPISVKLSRSR